MYFTRRTNRDYEQMRTKILDANHQLCLNIPLYLMDMHVNDYKQVFFLPVLQHEYLLRPAHQSTTLLTNKKRGEVTMCISLKINNI
jgi:hypothetical protein